MTQFGKFRDFCRDSTLPVCNVFRGSKYYSKSCTLEGFRSGHDRIGNLGLILLSGFAILTMLYLLWRSERKQAAVGRREIQIFLVAYLITCLSSIFSVGGIIDDHRNLLEWFSAVNVASITAACWILFLNGIVGYQKLDDGTWQSISLVLISALIFFIGTGYICLDTAFDWSGAFVPDYNLKNYALYVLYLLFPLICIVGFFVLESVLVLHVLGEVRPMILLAAAALLFTIGEIFEFVINVHICKGTNGAIDGSMFQALFTLLAVVAVWLFWSSITEDTWHDEPYPPTMSDAEYCDSRRYGRFLAFFGVWALIVQDVVVSSSQTFLRSCEIERMAL